MRVIAGSAKGRRLVGPNTRDTRPLTDRAKEGIFSAIGERVIHAEVLDLYAGSGSIGIEALSRGARRATFVENARRALGSLHQNLANLGFEDRAVVVNQAVGTFLSSAEGPYDLIFFDPPWSIAIELLSNEFEAAAAFCSEDSEAVIHRRRSDPNLDAPAGWSLIGTYFYGDSRLSRYRGRSANLAK